MNYKSYNKQKGFSLIEILVAFGIMAILTIVLASVFNSASKAFSITDKKTELYQNARIVLDQISREVRTAMVYNVGTKYGFHIRAGDTYFPPLDGLAGTRSLYFLGPWSVNTDQVSQTVEFGYYIDHGPDNTIDRDNILMRCAEPDRVSGAANPRYNYMTDSDWMKDNQFEPLAYGVSDLQITWYGRTPEAWQGGEYNPSNPPGLPLRPTIPRAIRIVVQMIHPADEIRYAGDAARIDSLKVSFNTTVYLNNSPGF